MTANKQTVERIVEYWGLGMTAEETVIALDKNQKIRISLHTVYNLRKSLTAKELIEEMLRKQQRSIFKAETEHPELAMKYRDKLLERLMPQKLESKTDLNISSDSMMGWMVDPELKKALLEEHNRQMEERAKRLGTAGNTSEATVILNK